MQKLIPVGIKIIGIIIVGLAILFPLIVVNMSASWDGQSPPNAPSGFQEDVMTFSVISADVKNVTYDNQTNKFVAQPANLDDADAFSRAVRLITTINTVLFIFGEIFALVGAVLTYLRGRTKIGAVFTVLGGLMMISLAGWSFMIQNLLLQALSASGGTLSGNTVTFTMSSTVNGTTYNWITKTSISLGLGVYLLLFGGIITLISLFLKSDEE